MKLRRFYSFNVNRFCSITSFFPRYVQNNDLTKISIEVSNKYDCSPNLNVLNKDLEAFDIHNILHLGAKQINNLTNNVERDVKEKKESNTTNYSTSFSHIDIKNSNGVFCDEKVGKSGVFDDGPVPTFESLEKIEEDKLELKVIVKDHLNCQIKVQPIKKFSHLFEDIPSWLTEGIQSVGYTVPMPVQQIAIPLLMESHDVIGIAPTGSGKTIAFAIPSLAMLDPKNSIRGVGRAFPAILVLCPTRELTQQTHKVFIKLAHGGPIIQAVFGGQDREFQINYLRRRGADVVIAAPGRLCDLLDEGSISLEKVNFLVLDEADRMLEMGFAPQLSKIMGSLAKDAQRTTMMWSATWSDIVGNLANSFLNPKRLTINVEGDGHSANKYIDQRVYALKDYANRMDTLMSLYNSGIITKDHKVLIFAKFKNEIYELEVEISKALGLSQDRIQGLHGDLRQGKRSAIIKKYREGYIRILVATDIAARGIDVPEIDHVVNYDLPLQLDSYIHRIGRTGRAGRLGMSHTFISTGDMSSIVAALGEYYASNKVVIPNELNDTFTKAKQKNHTERYERYRSHNSYNGDHWKTHGRDPSAPRRAYNPPRSVPRS